MAVWKVEDAPHMVCFRLRWDDLQVGYAGKNGHDVAAAAAAAAASSSGRRLAQFDFGGNRNGFNNPSSASGAGSANSGSNFNNGGNFGGNKSELQEQNFCHAVFGVPHYAFTVSGPLCCLCCVSWVRMACTAYAAMLLHLLVHESSLVAFADRGEQAAAAAAASAASSGVSFCVRQPAMHNLCRLTSCMAFYNITRL